jgi:hypothetical protein
MGNSSALWQMAQTSQAKRLGKEAAGRENELLAVLREQLSQQQQQTALLQYLADRAQSVETALTGRG